MRILFLSTWFPFPTDNGSKIRVKGLLEGLAHQHEVTLLSFAGSENVNPDAPEIRKLCQEVRVFPARFIDGKRRRTLTGALNPTPQAIQDTFSPDMADCIRETLASQEFDLVIASQLGTAVYSAYFGNTPALFEEAEIGVLYGKYAQAGSPSARARNGLTWLKHRRYMASLLPNFQACTVVSEQERQLLSQQIPQSQSIEVIPNFICLDEYKRVTTTTRLNQIIFTGPFRYFANYEAMVWFLKEVYPLIQAQLPEVNLIITGDHANLPLPQASNVTLTGVVEDIKSLIASSGVAIVPLRSGGGTRLKILEAMALGVPVVSTTKGAEGLDLSAGQHLLIADTPQAFAECVVRALKDISLGKEIASRARQVVAENYDQAVIIPRFLDLVDRIGRSAPVN